jgi:hypothetical protein
MTDNTLIIDSRQVQIASLGIAAAICLYAIFALIAEPVRTFAATTANTVVALDIAGTSSVTCSATVFITTATGAIPGQWYGTGGTMATCNVSTTNALGYTLRWFINTGSGGYGTGHLNSNNVTGGHADSILAYKPATVGTPETFGAPNGANPDTTSRWAARVKSASTTSSGVAGRDWGTDGSSEKWLNVATGSALGLIKRTSSTTLDREYIQYHAYIGSNSAQPTGNYKANVEISIIDN